jgi:hypothetical protein
MCLEYFHLSTRHGEMAGEGSVGQPPRALDLLAPSTRSFMKKKILGVKNREKHLLNRLIFKMAHFSPS